jgi:hypothetical protein
MLALCTVLQVEDVILLSQPILSAAVSVSRQSATGFLRQNRR